MPTYDYVCAGCGHAFEAFQEMSAKKLRTCPKCKKPRLERQVGTGAGLIFKGSGFYITDYRKGGDAGGKPAEGSGSSSAPAPATGGSTPAAPAAGSSTSTSTPAAPTAPSAPAQGGKGSKGGKGGGRKG